MKNKKIKNKIQFFFTLIIVSVAINFSCGVKNSEGAIPNANTLPNSASSAQLTYKDGCINASGTTGLVCAGTAADGSDCEIVGNSCQGVPRAVVQSSCQGETIAGVCFPSSQQTGGLSEKGILDILESFLSWMFALFFILSIGAFIISGVQYLVSGGDTGIIDTAKRNMKWSLVGVIVGMSGFIILQAISLALSGSPIF